MTNECNQYTPKFKLEAISLVVNHHLKVTDVATSVGIAESTLQKLLSQHRQKLNDQAATICNALTDDDGYKEALLRPDKRREASALLAFNSLNGYR